MLATLLLLLLPTLVAATGPARWHRLNPFTSSEIPEHERFSCLTNDTWACRYDKIPEPSMGFTWDRTRGTFEGTVGGTCPTELGDLCEHVVTVVTGTAQYVPESDPPFTKAHQLLLTDGDGVAPLYVYWVGEFACPWHTTFDEALDESPDCILPG